MLLLSCCLQISNYAKPGHRSRHNQVYWHCQPYYAFGLGAASYTRGRLFTRPRVMQEYEQWVQGYVASGAGCPALQLPQESQVSAKCQLDDVGRVLCAVVASSGAASEDLCS